MRISEIEEGFFDRFTAAGRERNAMQTRISQLQKDLEMGWAGQEPVLSTAPGYDKQRSQIDYLSQSLYIPPEDIAALTSSGNLFRNAAIEYIRRKISPPAPKAPPAPEPKPKFPVGKKVPVGGVYYVWSGTEWVDTTTGKPATAKIATAIDAILGT